MKRAASGTAAELDPALRPVVEALQGEPGVTYGGAGFGSTALKVNGKIFAMLSSRREFVLKLPRARVDALRAAGQGSAFGAGKDRILKEWVALKGAPGASLALAREALRFVGGKSR